MGEFPEEKWAVVQDFPRYQVSDLGRVRRAKTLGVHLTPHGYPRVALWAKGSKHPVYKLVHRLVLEAFVGPCPDGMEGCHNDGNPGNPRLDNLRWDTRSGNHMDKHRHGTMLVGPTHWTVSKPNRMPYGSRHWASKLSDEQVAIIAASVGRCRDVGDEFGVCANTVSRIRRGLRRV